VKVAPLPARVIGADLVQKGEDAVRIRRVPWEPQTNPTSSGQTYEDQALGYLPDIQHLLKVIFHFKSQPPPSMEVIFSHGGQGYIPLNRYQLLPPQRKLEVSIPQGKLEAGPSRAYTLTVGLPPNTQDSSIDYADLIYAPAKDDGGFKSGAKSIWFAPGLMVSSFAELSNQPSLHALGAALLATAIMITIWVWFRQYAMPAGTIGVSSTFRQAA